MEWKGAEAELSVERKGGKKLVLKKRLRKNYRNKFLDAKIRRLRTRREARILRGALQAGAAVPKIFFDDEEKHEVGMQLVEGTLLARLVEKNSKNLPILMERCGEELARLHAAGIVHGDFTTSNIIAQKNSVVVIDFGLSGFSRDVEEKAEDVLLFKKSLGEKKLFKKFEESYLANAVDGKAVLRRVQKIVERARYAI